MSTLVLLGARLKNTGTGLLRELLYPISGTPIATNEASASVIERGALMWLLPPRWKVYFLLFYKPALCRKHGRLKEYEESLDGCIFCWAVVVS